MTISFDKNVGGPINCRLLFGALWATNYFYIYNFISIMKRCSIYLFYCIIAYKQLFPYLYTI